MKRINFKKTQIIAIVNFIFVLSFFVSFNKASAFIHCFDGIYCCSLSPDPSTVCSPATNGTGYGYCTKNTSGSTCNLPNPGTGYTLCLNGTKDCSSVTCTSFTYSAWSACIGNVQTRTVLTSSPAGCTGGNPILSQSCCIANASSGCYRNDIYWYDSCGAIGAKKTECHSDICETDEDVNLYCQDGNVWGNYDFWDHGCSSGSCFTIYHADYCGAEIIETCSSRPTDCGYGTCASNEKPTWGCTSGACNYSCSYDSNCEGQAPNAIIDLPTGDQTVDIDDVIKFSGHGTDNDGTITAYEWRLGSCDETGVLLKKEELGDIDFNPLQSSFNQAFGTSDTLNVYFKVRDNTGMWSTCQTIMVTVSGAYSCSGLVPDGTFRISCPESETNLSSDLPWTEAGTSPTNCGSTKCQYYSPFVPSTCLPPPDCGSGDCGKTMESYCNDGSGLVAEEKCDLINGTDVNACNSLDKLCSCPSMPVLNWKEVAP